MRIDVYATSGRTRAKKTKIKRLIKKVLAAEDKQLAAVNVILTDDQYLTRLNEMYFKKKHATNVISFDLGEVSEIYVCEDRADDVYELYYFILHGLLHVIGYDHRNKREERLMKKKCVEYLSDE